MEIVSPFQRLTVRGAVIGDHGMSPSLPADFRAFTEPIAAASVEAKMPARPGIDSSVAETLATAAASSIA